MTGPVASWTVGVADGVVGMVRAGARSLAWWGGRHGSSVAAWGSAPQQCASDGRRRGDRGESRDASTAGGGLSTPGVSKVGPQKLRRWRGGGRADEGEIQVEVDAGDRPRPHVNAVLVGHVAPGLVAGLAASARAAAATVPHRSRRRGPDGRARSTPSCAASSSAGPRPATHETQATAPPPASTTTRTPSGRTTTRAWARRPPGLS